MQSSRLRVAGLNKEVRMGEINVRQILRGKHLQSKDLRQV